MSRDVRDNRPSSFWASLQKFFIPQKTPQEVTSSSQYLAIFQQCKEASGNWCFYSHYDLWLKLQSIEREFTICKVKVTQLCPTLCNPMDYTVHGILQARILEWVAFPFSSRSCQPWIFEPGSLASQADSLPTELSGKPRTVCKYLLYVRPYGRHWGHWNK